MKNILKYLVILLILAVVLLNCNGGADAEWGGLCGSPELVIKNSNEYEINSLYAHNTPVYNIADTPIATNIASEAEVNYPVNAGDVRYFTFIRNFPWSSTTDEIAVTTSQPVVIEDCTQYRLHILETDFFIEQQ